MEIKKHMNFRTSQILTFKTRSTSGIQQHMDTIKFELSKANDLLAKRRYYVGSKLLKTIYSAIFESHH